MFYVVTSLPLLMLMLAFFVWWPTLHRPWVFAALGIAVLYVLLALLVVGLVFIGPGFKPYFLEQPALASGVRSVTVAELFAIVLFLAIGSFALWSLKQWLQP